MSSHPVITRSSRRQRERWAFRYNAERHDLEPESYRIERRRDERYRFRLTGIWTRLYRAQNSRLTRTEVPLPAEVRAEAKHQFCRDLTVGGEKEKA